MKKILSIVILLFVLSSCGQKREAVSFEKIDVQINDQWGRNYSLQIDKEGNTTTSVDDPRSSKKDYSFLMNEQILDSISKVAKKIDIAKLDTGYNDSCSICIGYKITMMKDGQTVNTHVKNIQSNPNIADLDKLVSLLYNVVRTTDRNPEALKRKTD
ncbi:exported hypothetical protein [uncultured Paludibacter sp.]|uniref:Lipoprotein n=1 Tax=uncultured Paludibacter sp. TaxID=497635 RepID=A0A653AEQ1_9BACT|nr:exported hypothetical protein [uncultured Paludibacter sp.]